MNTFDESVRKLLNEDYNNYLDSHENEEFNLSKTVNLLHDIADNNDILEDEFISAVKASMSTLMVNDFNIKNDQALLIIEKLYMGLVESNEEKTNTVINSVVETFPEFEQVVYNKSFSKK